MRRCALEHAAAAPLPATSTAVMAAPPGRGPVAAAPTAAAFYCDQCRRGVGVPRPAHGAMWCDCCGSPARRLPHANVRRLANAQKMVVVRSGEEDSMLGGFVDAGERFDDAEAGKYFIARKPVGVAGGGGGVVVVNYLMFESFSLRRAPGGPPPPAAAAAGGGVLAPLVPRRWLRQPWNEFAVPTAHIRKAQQAAVLESCRLPAPDSPPLLALSGRKRPAENDAAAEPASKRAAAPPPAAGVDEPAAAAKPAAKKSGGRLKFTRKKPADAAPPPPAAVPAPAAGAGGTHSPASAAADSGGADTTPSPSPPPAGRAPVKQPAWKAMLRTTAAPLNAAGQEKMEAVQAAQAAAAAAAERKAAGLDALPTLTAAVLEGVEKVRHAGFARIWEYVAVIQEVLEKKGGYKDCPSCGSPCIHQKVPCCKYIERLTSKEQERCWYGPCPLFAVVIPSATCEAWNEAGAVLEGGKLTAEQSFPHHRQARAWMRTETTYTPPQ